MNEAKFVNCIGHDIVIEFPDGMYLRLPAAEAPATVKQTQVGSFGGLPIHDSYGQIENLPQEELNTVYIVSRMVRRAMDDVGLRRIDVMVPAEPVYDYVDGKRVVTACRALAR